MPNHQVHTGRVVLLGDSGYCPSAFTGMGTTLSLIGTYVLAGELARHPTDVAAALEAYEQTMKQPIEECQNLSGIAEGQGFYPASEWTIWATNHVLWTLSAFKVNSLIKWVAGFVPEGKEKRWEMPEYAELNCEAVGGS